jgi:outer membrane protein assembly factor BamB
MISRRSRFAPGLVLSALAACLALTACSDENKEKLGGVRISVLQFQQKLEVDPQLADQPIQLPDPVVNENWSQPGGNAAHYPGHVQLDGSLEKLWSAKIAGSDSTTPLLSGPIVVGNRLYVVDVDYNLLAFDASIGKKIWQSSLLRENQEKGAAFGGGVSYDGGRLFASTGFGDSAAIDPENGKVIWRQRIAGPIRSAPIVADGRAYVSAVDNQVIALSAENRALQWTHTGFLEQTALLGGSGVAVDGQTVLVPYSSGQIFALRAGTGRVAWQDSLASVRRSKTVAGLSDIRGLPVTADGVVYAISHSGRMAAIDIRSGQRVWEQDIGSITTPAVVGDWIFVISTEAQLVALSRKDGRVRWISPLQRYEDEQDREGPVIWSAPLVAGGRLLLVNNLGELVEANLADGKVAKKMKLSGPALLSPVIAGGVLYVLTEDGVITAYR